MYLMSGLYLFVLFLVINSFQTVLAYPGRGLVDAFRSYHKRAAAIVPSYTNGTNNYVYMGCILDNSTHTLSRRQGAGNISATICNTNCAGRSYPLMGVGPANCWCDYNFLYFIDQGDAGCPTPCPADGNQICGKTSNVAISVYRNIAYPSWQTSYADENKQSVINWGCYNATATRAIGVALNATIGFNATTMTVQQCATACSTKLGYTYSGVFNGATCFCSSSAPTNSNFLGWGSGDDSTMVGCNVPCPGNSTIMCGGPATVNLYSTFPLATIASFVGPNGWTVNPVGCYVDSREMRLLTINLSANYNPALAAPQVCQAQCIGLGYPYSGVEYGAECWCGSSISSGVIQSPLFCNMPCPGMTNSTSCGGSNAISIYLTNIGTLPGILSNFINYRSQVTSYYGCYADSPVNSPSNRALPTKILNIANLTPLLCVNACAQAGMTFAGVEWGSECWCGNSISSTSLPYGYCDQSCAGNTSLRCGQANRLTVYQMIASSSVNPLGNHGLSTSIGCYSDAGSDSGVPAPSIYGSRALQGAFFSAVASPDNCVQSCSSEGWIIAGISGSKCWCDSSIQASSGLVASTSCSTPCSGEPSTSCGNSDLNYLQVYFSVVSIPVPLRGMFNTTYSYNTYYMACVRDSLAARTFSYQVTSIGASTMTPLLCINACGRLGFLFAGLQYGIECWCSSQSFSQSNLAALADCSQPCSGNISQACGSSLRLSVYNLGSLLAASAYVPAANGYSLLGCAQDNYPSSRVLRNYVPITSLTVGACTQACFNLGYSYAGVEYSTECYCDINFNGNILGSNTTCVAPCSGAPSSLCGGDNALNVYFNPAAVRTTLLSYTTTSSSIAWLYKACWGEPSGYRALKSRYNNPLGTVQACLELGSQRGMAHCGLEYGGECWCDSTPPAGGQISEAYCSQYNNITYGMSCAGDVLHWCGSGNVFNYYSTSTRTYSLWYSYP